MSIEIKPFKYKCSTDYEYRAFTKCRNQIRAEQLPDDPPMPMEETVQGFKKFPAFLDMSIWVAWDKRAENVVAYGLIQLSHEDNLHMAQFVINVLPGFRRQGFGREFLSRIVEVAKVENRRLLITDTIDRIPGGEAFMNRLGAEKGLEEHTNQLTIDDLDSNLLRQWQDRAKDRGAGFEIGVWEGKYPETYIDAIVALHDLLNQQPFGNLEVEDFTFSADHIRQGEKSLFARGYERWTLYVRERHTEKFAGYTEVLWNPNRQEIIDQGMTGIFPEFRNKGLGRWLKAEMLAKIISNRPQAKFIRTQNADINAPMMKINNELGFKPYISGSVWQVETEKVSEYLSSTRD